MSTGSVIVGLELNKELQFLIDRGRVDDLTLRNLLLQWKFMYSDKIRSSMLSLFAFKFGVLREMIKRHDADVTARYQNVLTGWHTFLQDVVQHNEGLDAFYDGNALREVLKDHYPTFFSDQMHLQNLKTLCSEMKHVSKNRDKWANRNIASLYKHLYEMHMQILGRPDILNQVAKILIAFANNWQKFTGEYMNFIITGAAGSGKSRIAEAIGNVMAFSGLVFRNKFIEKGKHHFIGQYLGQSAPLTIAVLNEGLESVVFIDEAYNLASCESPMLDAANNEVGCKKFDSYGEESISSMLAFLSTHKGQIVVIVAGYKEAIAKSLLAINEGFSRRFPYRFDLEAYSAETLYRIFVLFLEKKMTSASIIDAEAKDWFIEALGKSHKDQMLFLNQAGDVENVAAAVSTWSALHPGRVLTLCFMVDIVNKYLFETFQKAIMRPDSCIETRTPMDVEEKGESKIQAPDPIPPFSPLLGKRPATTRPTQRPSKQRKTWPNVDVDYEINDRVQLNYDAPEQMGGKCGKIKMIQGTKPHRQMRISFEGRGFRQKIVDERFITVLNPTVKDCPPL